MTGLTPLTEERAEEFAEQLEDAVAMMGTNDYPIEVSYRLNLDGLGGINTTEFIVEGFTSMYAEDIPDLLEDDEYIASLGTHLDTEEATISIVSEETVEGDIFL